MQPYQAFWHETLLSVLLQPSASYHTWYILDLPGECSQHSIAGLRNGTPRKPWWRQIRLAKQSTFQFQLMYKWVGALSICLHQRRFSGKNRNCHDRMNLCLECGSAGRLSPWCPKAQMKLAGWTWKATPFVQCKSQWQ